MLLVRSAVDGSQELGLRSRHTVASTYASLVLLGKVLPAAVVFGVRFGSSHLQEVAVGSTQGVGGIHELRHFFFLDVEHALQHCCHLFLGSLSLSCDSHLDFQRSIFVDGHVVVDGGSDGQQYDMEFETRNDVKEEEYIEMIRLKTSVLLACALKIGAILADASEEDADNLYKFGEQIGLAFQLQDDYLDVYGDTKVFGKAIGGDITSNKKTFMLINAFNHANEAQRAELQKWVDAQEFDREEKVAAVTRLYNEIGIDKLAQDKIAYYFEQSKKYLDAVNVPADRKEELAKYAQKMMKRQY